jgi:SAM-dependent methyltransferase
MRRLRAAVRDPAWAARRARAKLGLVTAHLPGLRAKELLYSDAYFEQLEERHGTIYRRLAEELVAVAGPVSVVDVGCGSGILLAELADRGVEVRGVEGSRPAIRRSRVADRIVRHDLERGVPELGRFDLALCIEVAEHLPASAAPGLVEGLARLSDRVLFSAAPPGQGGDHHVHERPRSYWEELFAASGLAPSALAATLVERLADVDDPPWIKQNLMSFAAFASGS